MTHFTLKILQIKDQNILIDEMDCQEKQYKGQTALFFKGKLDARPKACPHCGQVDDPTIIVKNGTRSSQITLAPVSGLPAYLHLVKQRYLCRSCCKSCTAKTSIVQSHCFISQRVKQMVAAQATQTVSEAHIAKELNVSTTTVRRTISEFASEIRIRPTHALPNHLSFDEFKSVKSVDAAMSFIMIDAETHQLIDVLPDRKKGALIQYFRRYSRAVRRQVETVTIDMYSPYMDVIKQCFPNAKIIIDPFHLIQAVYRALNQCRVQCMNQHRSKNKPLYNKFKRYWKLLLTPNETLNSFNYQKHRLFPSLMTTQGIVDYLLSQDDVLSETYTYAHGLRFAYRLRHWELFLEYMDRAQTAQISPQLKKTLRSFRKYLPYIKNAFTYSQFTNGPIEGLNNKIKVLKRTGYGYRNFSHFRDRILLMTRLYVPPSKHIEKDQVA